MVGVTDMLMAAPRSTKATRAAAQCDALIRVPTSPSALDLAVLWCRVHYAENKSAKDLKGLEAHCELEAAALFGVPLAALYRALHGDCPPDPFAWADYKDKALRRDDGAPVRGRPGHRVPPTFRRPDGAFGVRR